MAEADRRGVASFIHIGSSGAVGHDEDSPPTALQLENHYFLSKRDGDDRIAAFEPASGMKIVAILPGWMWGPGDAGPTAAGRLCLDFMAGKLPVVPDGGTSVVDARDVATATIRAIERGEHRDRFIVGGSYISLMDCTRALADASGHAAPRFEAPAWLALAVAHVGEFAARLRGQKPSVPVFGLKIMLMKHNPSSARSIRRLDARFRPFGETARDVVAWYRLHGKDFGIDVPAA
jgi:dihydroflavonol-4-reductase